MYFPQYSGESDFFQDQAVLAKLHTLFHAAGQTFPLDLMLQHFTVVYHSAVNTHGLSHRINTLSVYF